jgi:hypothetical protein
LILTILILHLRELFTKIGEEDLDFASDVDSDFEIPEFGDSTSDYEEVIL